MSGWVDKGTTPAFAGLFPRKKLGRGEWSGVVEWEASWRGVCLTYVGYQRTYVDA